MSSSNDMFDSPAASEGFKWEDHKGRLLLITAHAIDKVSTSFGEKDAARADITILDGDNAGDVHGDILIFPKVILGQVRPNVATGRLTLGRLGQGNAKSGQKPPWILEDPSDADKTVARAHLQKTASVPF